MSDKPKNGRWVTAARAFDEYGVRRSWLRENANIGSIRRRVVTGTNPDGTEYVRNLYSSTDIEAMLEG